MNGITWTLLVLALIAVAVVGGWAIRYYTAPIRGTVGAYEQIQSAPMRITAYNHFFDLRAAVQGYDGQLEAMRKSLEENPSKKEKERIVATIAGIEGARARAVAQYNADAQKDYTIGQFRDANLPYQIK